MKLTEAQQKLLDRIRATRSQSDYVHGAEVRAARMLEGFGLLVLRDDGDARDGLQWFVALKESAK